jgi:tetratricopeptide (TPR) repeat protein
MYRLLYLFTVLFLTASMLSADEREKAKIEREGAIAFNQGSQAYSAGKYAESIPFLLTADSLIGESAKVDRLKLRFTTGLAYLKNKQPENAIELFQWVAGQDSSYPFIQLQLADAYRKTGNSGKALLHYRAGLDNTPDSQKHVILLHIATLLEKRKDWNGAVKAYSQALALDPLPDYNFRRGLLYNRLAEPIDRAGDDDYDFEEAVTSGRLTEEALLKAIGLREKALADFRLASKSTDLVDAAARMIERTEIMIKNDQTVIAEIHYIRNNE